MSRRTPWVAQVGGGVVLGVLLTVLVTSALGDDDTGEPASGSSPTPAATSSLPSDQPSDQPSDLPTLDPEASSDAEDEPEEPEESEEPEEGEEPDSAPLLADAAPAGEGPLPDADPVRCPAATVEVYDAASLQAALDDAGPGTVVSLADGTYDGHFAATTSGSERDPAWLCGGPGAVLDGGDPEEDGYTLHLDGARYWRLVGFTVTGGQKGVMADGTVGSVLQGLTVRDVGDEAVHLRSHSTDNVVRDTTISGTGLREDRYGEGVYIGSAVSNWCTYTDCEADRSDRNVVVANTITGTTSEPIDIKEGTTGGVLLDNVLDGSAMTEADTWVNLKGNNYLVRGNTGTAASDNGFEVHDILPGWGDFNVFDANTGVVGGAGYGIAAWPEASNVVTCTNELTDAAEGVSNIPCS